MNTESLLHLFRMVSQALPVGAYAWSQGMESAVSRGLIQNESQARDWIGGVMEQGPGKLELPILLRQYQAWQQQDIDAVLGWHEQITAFRETRELLLEDRQLGRAFFRVLADEAPVSGWPDDEMPGFTAMFALAGVRHGIDPETLMAGFLWSWLENQVGVATKLVPLGQTAAQRILRVLIPRIPEICECARRIRDEDIGFSLPGLAILSSRHEYQEARLFRS